MAASNYVNARAALTEIEDACFWLDQLLGEVHTEDVAKRQLTKTCRQMVNRMQLLATDDLWEAMDVIYT